MKFIQNRPLSRKIIQLLLVVFSFAVIFSMVVYHFTPGNDSDYVEGVLWANETLAAGRLLNPEFYYPYAIPFGANIFMLPFVKFLGVSQLANSLGMLLFFAVLLFTCFCFVRVFTDEFVPTIFGVAIILLAYRSLVGVNTFHHILFYQLGFICFLGMFSMAMKCIDRGFKMQYIIGLIGYSVWAGMNGVISITLSAIPMGCALLVSLLLQKDKQKSSKTTRCGCFLLCGVIVGYVVYLFAMRNIQEAGHIEGVGTYTFLSVDSWIENARQFPVDWFRIFAFSPENKRITSAEGIEIIIAILYGLLVGIIPPSYIIHFKKLTEKERILYISSAVIWIVCIMQYILLRGALDRLLYNAVLANGALIAVIVLRHYQKLSSEVIGYLSSGVMLILCIYSVAFPVKADWNIDTSVTDFLYENGLRNGFATYWHAGINTVNSEGKVNVRPIVLNNDGQIGPWKFQSADSWYLSNQVGEEEKWFILLSESEWNEVNQSINKAPLELLDEEIQFEGYHILVYQAEEWDDIIHHQHVIYNFASTEWQKGCLSSSEGRLIPDGGLNYGPYVPVLKDETIHVRIQGNALSHAIIDVYEWDNPAEFELCQYEQTDNSISFDVVVSTDLKHLEIAISNPENDDFKDSIEIVSEEIIVEKPNT